jgi:hypothetical protein
VNTIRSQPQVKNIFLISPKGDVSFVHDDAFASLINADPKAKIHRLSHVEPGDPTKGQDCRKWYVDFSPSGLPDILGPYDERAVALIEEKAFVDARPHLLTGEAA